MFKLKYFWPYILFFGSIVLLVLANMFNIDREIKRNLAYTKTLNVAGKQRMFSQKLTKLSYEATAGKDVQADMSSTLTTWTTAHNNLLNNGGGLSTYMEEYPEIKDSFRNIESSFQHLQTRFENIASGSAIVDISMLNSIGSLEREYLQKMDDIVSRLEMNATNDLEQSKKNQSLLALLSGVFLVIEMIVFIYPYHKRFVNAYKKVKGQQEELEEKKDEIEALYETNDLIIRGTNAGIWEWDIATGNERWSDRFYTILGYQKEDLKPTYDTLLNVLLHPDDKMKVLRAVDSHIKKRTPYKHEVRMLTKNGDYRWFETSGQAVWDEEGKALRIAGSIIDITNRVATKEKLLAESNTKDKLLSIVTHDLRSPVNNLRALLDLLKTNVINKEDFIEHLNATAENVDSLSQSMDNMLTWAQSQLRGWDVNPSEILVDDAVLDCVRLYQHVLDEKNIKLNYKSSELLKAYADFNQIELIIRNILNNAIKFTPENGSISIDAVDEDGYATVIVKDSGKGMDQQTINKVLNRNDFFTTYGTNGERGTGLGMNMCVDFAEKNKCQLSINSDLGNGTSVTLKMPKSA